MQTPGALLRVAFFLLRVLRCKILYLFKCFNGGKIHTIQNFTTSTILSVQFTGMKHIRMFVHPCPPQNFSQPAKVESPWPLSSVQEFWSSWRSPGILGPNLVRTTKLEKVTFSFKVTPLSDKQVQSQVCFLKLLLVSCPHPPQ